MRRIYDYYPLLSFQSPKFTTIIWEDFKEFWRFLLCLFSQGCAGSCNWDLPAHCLVILADAEVKIAVGSKVRRGRLHLAVVLSLSRTKQLLGGRGPSKIWVPKGPSSNINWTRWPPNRCGGSKSGTHKTETWRHPKTK